MMTKTTPKRVSTIILALILTALLSTAAFAAESRASALIFSHSCSASAGTDGEMDVTFSITGKKIMSTIGAKSIYFYVKNGNAWKFDKLYTQYYIGMSAENKLTHGNTITVKAKLFCPEIAGLFCRIAGLFCHDSRANLSLKPVCFGIAIS